MRPTVKQTQMERDLVHECWLTYTYLRSLTTTGVWQGWQAHRDGGPGGAHVKGTSATATSIQAQNEMERS